MKNGGGWVLLHWFLNVLSATLMCFIETDFLYGVVNCDSVCVCVCRVKLERRPVTFQWLTSSECEPERGCIRWCVPLWGTERWDRSHWRKIRYACVCKTKLNLITYLLNSLSSLKLTKFEQNFLLWKCFCSIFILRGPVLIWFNSHLMNGKLSFKINK